MWDHIWIAYGEVLFTVAISRSLASISWTNARLPGVSRLIPSNIAATIGMLIFALSARPASPPDAYLLALAVFAVFTASIGLTMLVQSRRKPRPAADEAVLVQA